MVDHDDVDPARREPRDRLDRRGAAIDREEQLRRVLLDAAFHAVPRESVAFLHPQRQEGRDVARAEPAQHAGQQRGRGDAIHVIVAEDDDALLRGDRRLDALRRAPQSGEHERIAERLQARIEERADLLAIAMAAVPEQRRDLVVKRVRPRQFQRLGARRAVDPAAAQCAEFGAHGVVWK